MDESTFPQLMLVVIRESSVAQSFRAGWKEITTNWKGVPACPRPNGRAGQVK